MPDPFNPQMHILNALNPAQHNQVMPNPIPAGGPVMQPGGGNAPPPQMMPPQGGGHGFGGFNMDAFKNALMDWRGLRPDHPMFGDMDPAARRDARLDYRGQIMDWRGQMPTPFGFGQQGIAVGEQYPGAMPINPAA